MGNWFKKLNVWFSGIAETKWASTALFLCSFADASFLPVPVTTFFLVLILMNKSRAFRYILIILLGTLAGGIAGYLVGHYAWLKPNGEFTGVVQFLMNNIPGLSVDLYERVHNLFIRWDFWILCGAAATPIPIGVFSITSGVFGINIFLFLFATLLSHGIKFLLITYFTLKISPNLKRLVELNWKSVAVLTSGAFVIAILVFRAI